MSASRRSVALLATTLTGCIWISEEAFQERAACAPWPEEERSDLAIPEALNVADTDVTWEGGRLDGDAEYQNLGRHVTTVGDLDGDGNPDGMVGGQTSIYLATVSSTPSRDGADGAVTWTSYRDEEVSGIYYSAADSGDLSGDEHRDALVLTVAAGSGDASSTGLRVLTGDGVAGGELTLTGALWNGGTTYALLDLGAAVLRSDTGAGVLLAGWSSSSAGALFYLDADQIADQIGDDPASLSDDDVTKFPTNGTESPDLGNVTVASVGDLDGEGTPEAVIGAPAYSLAGDRAGAALVLSVEDPSQGPILSDLGDLTRIWEDTDDAVTGIGFVVASAGDLDGDGYNDVLLGSHPGSSSEPGAARLIFGAPPHGDASHTDLVPPDDVTDFGSSLAGGGDLDADCIWDVVVGGVRDDLQVRFVFLGEDLLGGSTHTPVADVTLETGETVEGATPLAQLADLNGDLYADILMGDPGASTVDGSQEGAVYLFFGGPDP